jgi:hypothetical protein
MNRHPQPKKPNNLASWGVITFGCPQCRPLFIGDHTSHGLDYRVD